MRFPQLPTCSFPALLSRRAEPSLCPMIHWNSLPGSLPCGSILGIPVRLHVLFLVVLALQVLGSIYYGVQWMLLWFLLLGPVLLFTVLIHELGHCFGARSVGGVVQGILLWPLGGLAFIGHTAGPKADMWVAIAGPLTHLPMTGFWLAMLAVATHAATGSWEISLALPDPSGAGLGQALCAGAVVMNLSMLAFNLLVPAYPLDGGRLLVDALLVAGVDDVLTARITLGLAVPLAIGVCVFGIVVFEMVTIMVGVFILLSCWSLWTFLRDGNLRQHPLFAFTDEVATNEHSYWKMGGGPNAGSQV